MPPRDWDDMVDLDEDGLDLVDDDQADEPQQPSRAQVQPAARVDYAAEVQAWDQEVATRKAEYDQAKVAWEQAETAFDTADGTVADKVAAMERAMEAKAKLVQAEGYRDSTAAQAERNQGQPSLNPAAQAWVDANPRFQSDQAFADQAVAAAKALEAEGYDKSSPKFYEQLDRRMRRSPRMQSQGHGSGAPVSRSGSGTAEPKGKASQFDEKFMRRFGLDPNNPRHLNAWRANKRAMNGRGA